MARRVFLWVIAAALLGAAGSAGEEQGPAPEPPAAKNLILYLATGMGQHHYRLLETLCEQEERTPALAQCAKRLKMETSILDGPVPDTPAAGSTLATGQKCPAGRLSVSPQGEPLPTLLEEARQSGCALGLVTLGDLTDGAITAFAAHSSEPDDFEARARQLFEAGIEVLVGKDREVFERASDATGGPCLLTEMQEAGYTLVKGSRGDFLRVMKTPMVAFFEHTFRADRRAFPNESELPQILYKVLSLLKGNPGGFLLIVETPALDACCRIGDSAGVASEMLQLDEAVEAGLRFAGQSPETLVVVVSPHETGNLLTVERELPRFVERFSAIRSSSVRADREIGESASLARVLKIFQEVVGMPLEQPQAHRLSQLAPGPERVRAIAKLITRHLGGVLIIQDCPSARSVRCFVHGPGAEDWPEVMDNSELAPRLRRQLGLDRHEDIPSNSSVR